MIGRMIGQHRFRAAALPVALAAALLLGACANHPDRYEPLAQLQSEVRQLRQTPLPTLAPTGFAEAELALSRAERSLGDVPLEEIRHLTSLAEIRLATVRAEAAAAAARQERETLLQERRTMLGTARERQLEAERNSPAGRSLVPGPGLSENGGNAPTPRL